MEGGKTTQGDKKSGQHEKPTLLLIFYPSMRAILCWVELWIVVARGLGSPEPFEHLNPCSLLQASHPPNHPQTPLDSFGCNLFVASVPLCFVAALYTTSALQPKAHLAKLHSIGPQKQ